MTDCRETRVLIGALALGGLADDETRDLLAHLAGCLSCSATHARLSDVVELIDLAGPEETLQPPPGFEERLIARAGSAPAPEPRARRASGARRLASTAVSALAGAAMTVAVLAAVGLLGGSSTAPALPNAATVRLAPTAQAPGSSAVVYVITKGGGTTFALEARGLPRARPGERYEVWVSNKRGAYSAGGIEVTSRGWAAAVLHSPRAALPGSAIEISLVPAGDGTGFRTLVQGTLPLQERHA